MRVFTPKTTAMFPQAFGEIHGLANVKRAVSGLKDVDPSKARNRKRSLNIGKYFTHTVDCGPLSFITRHLHNPVSQARKPFDRLSAFDSGKNGLP
ncbi:MAG: hypothetical protein ABI273_15415 [Lacunisphaera sp.]